MNSDIIKGKWKQLSGRIKERWGSLTDDLDVAEGHPRRQAAGTLWLDQGEGPAGVA